MTSVAPVVTFKKGPSRRPQQSRNRAPSPTADEGQASSEAGPSTSSVVRPSKKNVANPLVQGTKRRRELNENGEEGDAGLDDFDYKAEEGLSGAKGDVYATRSTEWDLEAGGEAKIDGKKIKLNEDGEIDDGLYHGAAGYLKTINKRTDVLDKKMQTGPIRATTSIRTVTLVDYQPDVCKDYKETGFCGYGDSCKFLHDRGDYLAGWQLDKLDPNGGVPQEEEEEIEEVPFACLICRKEFTEPVVTKCGHYFCMKCAIERFQKSPKCYACGASTSGIFNKAEKILAKLEAKNKRKKEERGIVDEDDDGGIEIGGDEEEEEEGERGDSPALSDD
ncbi:hypothetical protein BD324DRAFT_640583 [Kockovaella imperatae]|uniref:Pre-mRNA-splicing factor CWC24 n=1 Tax=Kockovaella imperatae TaxID=4999 RepID=A0A1Y1URQ2_9TREE|nr:hypothetical protein BD324DRAFT_640583 [Kockovaella imperatae]ORX40730.1 hypothetical protein BD324DRAFT_640583 [Kockovaella imperatae]